MFCIKCGKPNEDGSAFCSFCGAAFEDLEPDFDPEPAPPARRGNAFIRSTKEKPRAYVIAGWIVMSAVILFFILEIIYVVKASNYVEKEKRDRAASDNNANYEQQRVAFAESFTVGGQDYGALGTYYSTEEEFTSFILEGFSGERSLLVFAAAKGALDYSATYEQSQSDFADKIEVVVMLLDKDAEECFVGSTATQGLSGAKIVTGSSYAEVAISGTLSAGEHGEIPFSVSSGFVMEKPIKTIRDKMSYYNTYYSTYNAPQGGGNG